MIEAGTRRLPEKEELKTQERRATEMSVALAKKEFASGPSLLFGDVPVKDKSSAAKSLASFYHLEDPAYLAQIHPSAYYYTALFYTNGKKVRLNDGSDWTVHPSYRAILSTWASNDPVFIKPNASWFSSYRYVLQNRLTGEVVEVNLDSIPATAGPYTHWVVAIDYTNGLIYLENGTRWLIPYNDRSLLKYWTVGDRVIIGVNNKWRFDLYRQILINVHTVNYCEANMY
jgi:hypothetical protein